MLIFKSASARAAHVTGREDAGTSSMWGEVWVRSKAGKKERKRRERSGNARKERGGRAGGAK